MVLLSEGAAQSTVTSAHQPGVEGRGHNNVATARPLVARHPSRALGNGGLVNSPNSQAHRFFFGYLGISAGTGGNSLQMRATPELRPTWHRARQTAAGAQGAQLRLEIVGFEHGFQLGF